MFNQKHALTILRAKLEGKTGRECFKCGRFGHLTCNCRNEKIKEKREKPQNKYKVLPSRVIQSGEEGDMR